MDTAQAIAPAETDPIADAANAFKAFTTGEPVAQPRDESGKFASNIEPEEEQAPEDDEALEESAEAADDADEDGEEAAEEAQPRPTSWPEDKAELWETLPADTKAYLAERDAEQLRAVNAKFQESANVRKAAEAAEAEAKATRENLASTLDALIMGFAPVKPDPRSYGAGTGQYNREAYDLDLAQYEQQRETYAQLLQQREYIAQQSRQEAEQAQLREAQEFEAWKQEVEQQFQPKFLADVPELTDPVKAEPTIRSMIEYAVSQGIPESTFAAENHPFITSPELHILWKAQQFDKLRASPPQPKQKQAGPAVKPGVSSPRSAQKAAQRAKINDRLAREGSVEAGAAMWKQLLKG